MSRGDHSSSVARSDGAAKSRSEAELRCETCAHWRFEQSDWEYDRLRFGECKGIKQREDLDSEATEGMEDRWGEEASRRKEAALKAAKAIAVDGSGYYAAVRTAPDFGCVLHTAKATGQAG